MIIKYVYKRNQDKRLLPVLLKYSQYGKYGKGLLNIGFWEECWMLMQLNTYGADLEISC